MIRIDDAVDVGKCWLSSEEFDRLERTAGAVDWEREIAIQFMGQCGLRADEVSYPADQYLRWSEDGDVWLFEVRGNNTTPVNRRSGTPGGPSPSPTASTNTVANGG